MAINFDHTGSGAITIKSPPSGTFTLPTGEYVSANSGTSYSINCSQADTFLITLTGNVTFTFTGASAGKKNEIHLVCVQDATANRTITWPTSVKWAAGTPPSIASGANTASHFYFLSMDSGTTWYGSLIGNNYDIVISNFWNPSDKNVLVTLSNGNKTASVSAPTLGWAVRGSTGKASGKWYFEGLASITGAVQDVMLGVGTASAPLDKYPGYTAGTGVGLYSNNGTYWTAGSGTAYATGWASGDVVRVAVDLDSFKIWFAINGAAWPNSGNPTTGANPATTLSSGTYYPMYGIHSGASQSHGMTLTQPAFFTYGTPSGFSAWGS
jgi:hypothetical protein